MAKMRRISVNGVFEFEGTPQELASICLEIEQRTNNIIPKIIAKNKPEPSNVIQMPMRLHFVDAELEAKMPSPGALVGYILSKPKYEHDIVDVGKRFFGQAIKSREEGYLYRKLRAELENARKYIETTKHGAFERRSTRPRNLQVYSFKPINSILFGEPSQKTS